MSKKRFLLNFPVIIFLFSGNLSLAQAPDGELNIRLNQIGFYPEGPKKAVILSGNADKFYVKTLSKKTVFTGVPKRAVEPDFAGHQTLIADFSAFNAPGKYMLYVPGIGYSYPFDIKKSVHKEVAAGAIK